MSMGGVQGPGGASAGPARPRPGLAARAAGFLVPAAAFLVADQLTKVWARAELAPLAGPVEAVPGVIDFTFVRNTGVSFGLASGFGWAFVALAVVVVAASAVYLVRARRVSWPEVIGLGMLAGGAIGNALDRVLFGYVTDFIATAFIDFPVFNVADIGVTVGVAVAFAGYLLLGGGSTDAGGGQGAAASAGEDVGDGR